MTLTIMTTPKVMNTINTNTTKYHLVQQVGVVSWREGFGKGAAFIDVSKYMDWINEVLSTN